MMCGRILDFHIIIEQSSALAVLTNGEHAL